MDPSEHGGEDSSPDCGRDREESPSLSHSRSSSVGKSGFPSGDQTVDCRECRSGFYSESHREILSPGYGEDLSVGRRGNLSPSRK